jgi:hypothetical protein
MKAALYALALLAAVVSAQARLNAVILGQPVSVPVLGLVAAITMLTLAAAVLVLLRLVVRDWPRARTAPGGA